MEGEGSAPRLGAGANDAVLLVPHEECEGDGAAFGSIPHPTTDILLAALLKDAVRNTVHEKTAFSDTIPAIYHRHMDRGEVKGCLGVASIVLDLHRERDEGPCMPVRVPTVVRLLDDGGCQLCKASGVLSGDFVEFKPAGEGFGRAIMLCKLFLCV